MNSELQALFVARLKEEMKNRDDMSINALARALKSKVGYASLNRILAGKQDPTLTKVWHIAEALGMPVWSLLVLDDQVEQVVIRPPVKKPLQTNVVKMPNMYPKLFDKRPNGTRITQRARKPPKRG